MIHYYTLSKFSFQFISIYLKNEKIQLKYSSTGYQEFRMPSVITYNYNNSLLVCKIMEYVIKAF